MYQMSAGKAVHKGNGIHSVAPLIRGGCDSLFGHKDEMEPRCESTFYLIAHLTVFRALLEMVLICVPGGAQKQKQNVHVQYITQRFKFIYKSLFRR